MRYGKELVQGHTASRWQTCWMPKLLFMSKSARLPPSYPACCDMYVTRSWNMQVPSGHRCLPSSSDPSVKGKAVTDKKHHLKLKSFKSSNSAYHSYCRGHCALWDCQEVCSPLPKMLQLLIFTLPAFWCFSSTGFPTPTGRWVIAFSAPCFLPLNTGTPRGPAAPISINPSCEVRERLFGKYLQRKISEFRAKVPTHVVIGGGDDLGIYYLQCVHWGLLKCLCILRLSTLRLH